MYRLSDKVEAEIARLDQCAKDWEDVASCLGLGGLEQSKLYTVMEDQTFVWRSMYVDHLQRWLKVFSPESMLVVPSESLKEASSFKTVMERFVTLMGLPRGGAEVHNELIFKASPASTGGNVHENGRSYVGEIPADLSERLNKVLCPKNQELAQLLLDKKLMRKVDEFPWLATALGRDMC